MIDREQNLTLAAARDAILTRRVSTFRHERFRSVVDRIDAADFSIANLETLLNDHEGSPARPGMEPHLSAPPHVADELLWCGFDAVAAASNHSLDYGRRGLETTMRELSMHGLPYAGAGEHLAAAREPTYVDTPADRVAVVAACSTDVQHSAAGPQSANLSGRPGVSPLRWRPTYVVPEAVSDTLRAASVELGLERAKEQTEALTTGTATGDAFEFVVAGEGQNVTIESGSEFDRRLVPSERDVTELCEQVKNANRQADWVVVSLHSHEGREHGPMEAEPARFVETFARQCAELGADVFVGHGPHVPRGVDIHEGTPIFYSLGNLFGQLEAVTRQPGALYRQHGLTDRATEGYLYDTMTHDDDDEPTGLLEADWFWRGLLAEVEFTDGSLSAVRVHPLDLLQGAPRPQRGRPLSASGAVATETLDRVAALSEPYGTEFAVEDGVAAVELG